MPGRACLMSKPPQTSMLRFVLVFMVLLSLMFLARITEPVRVHVTLPFTNVLNTVSTALVKLADSDVATDCMANGVQVECMRSPENGFAIVIAPGCDGIEAVIILVAAMLAFPAPWKHRMAGIGIGFLGIQALNVVRIISLFYLGQWSRAAFDWFHLYLWQALIVLDALAIFLVWLRYLPRRPTQSGGPDSGSGGAALAAS